ncbi:hypothetical protein ACWCWD_17855 [Streptomyces sp. NPDC001493]
MDVYARTTHPPIASRERHMHGYGYPPELPTARPSSVTLTVLRVVFVALTVLSCGFLAWTAMLRLAVVTRRARDWTLFVLSLALTAGLVAYTAAIPEDQEDLTDAQALSFLGWVLALVVGVTWYYLHQDIRHFGPGGPRGPRVVAAPGYPQIGPVAGYGYPNVAGIHQAPPYGAPPVPHHPQGIPTAPYQPSLPQQQLPVQPQPQPQPQPQLQPQPQPQPTPPPKRPGPPQRLDQVRAELDELSDYLRKEGEGR